MKPADHDPKKPRVGASRFLEQALLLSLLAHALAMGSMLLLLSGLPGALNVSLAARAAYVAGHPWVWRAGWFPWQLTALSNLLLAAALLKTRWIPKAPALFTAMVTIAAVVPDQTGQCSWTWIGPTIARQAARTGDFLAYAGYESHTFRHIAGLASIGYIAAAIGWTGCFVAAGVWSKGLTILSCIAWPIFAAATGMVFLPERIRDARWIGAAVGVGNAAGFVFLLTWLVTIFMLVRHRRA